MKTLEDLHEELYNGKAEFVAWLRKEHKRNFFILYDFDDGNFNDDDSDCHCPLATWIASLGYYSGYINNECISLGGWDRFALPEWMDRANRAFRAYVGPYKEGPIYISIVAVLDIMEFME